MDPENFRQAKERAQKIFATTPTIYNKYLQAEVTLNSDGFHHLQFSSRRERSKTEQNLKFRLLPMALDIIRKSTTLCIEKRPFK